MEACMFTGRMMYLLSAALLFSACSCSFPREPEEWTVMSWNVQNLFDAVDDGTEYPEFDPGREDWNENLYRKRLERTAGVIRNSGRDSPDLVILQEIENVRVLDDLASGPLRKEGYRWRLAVPGYSIIRCGILSRYPLKDIDVVDCGFYGIRSLRPALFFTVESPAGPVRVSAGHWKSPRDGRAATEGARCREASAVRDMLTPVLLNNPEAELLVIGDLNTSGDGLIRPAALAPWYPELNMEKDEAVLYHTDSPEGAGIRGGVAVFFDPEPDPAAGSPGTYRYHGEWDRPDRALISRGLIDPPGLVFEFCRTAPETAGDTRGYPSPWVSAREEGCSDHLPLVLVFRIADENRMK
jgi:hypothetical protein